MEGGGVKMGWMLSSEIYNFFSPKERGRGRGRGGEGAKENLTYKDGLSISTKNRPLGNMHLLGRKLEKAVPSSGRGLGFFSALFEEGGRLLLSVSGRRRCRRRRCSPLS